MIVVYRVGELWMRSEELILRFHPDGQKVVDKALNWKANGLNLAPGWGNELKETVKLMGAERFVAFNEDEFDELDL